MDFVKSESGIYLAHRSQETGRVQTLKEHLNNTAGQAREFAEQFCGGELAFACAALHDAGKYSAAFQNLIRGSHQRVDHSTAGAQVLARQSPSVGRLLAYCVAGHHGGLPAGGDALADTEADTTLAGRLKRTAEPCDAFFAENELPPIPARLPICPIGRGGFSCAFLIRMFYSCLTDSDFLDTERSMQGTGRESPAQGLGTLWEKLTAYLASLQPDGLLNRRRAELQRQCIAAARGERGLFSLAMPTGAGKTLASLAFALQHARQQDLRRIIYVIPYTSIIEQNAGKFAEVLGRRNVLEHHSNFNFDTDDDGVLRLQKLAAENWDAPLVVTTNVQFFESLFADRPSRCRKLHNIANSVVIFDEAQMFPTPYLKPCVQAIAELVQNYRCTAVLCSATRPALDALFPEYLPIRELVPQTPETEERNRCFVRTRFEWRGKLENDALTAELLEQRQALCIVNTRAHACDLYEALRGPDTFHLSAAMCPAHRSEVLAEIKRRLNPAVNEPCRVVSTQLVEAGVDLDFPVVYRALAGIDSLVQSAGRCNREGRRGICPVYVFEPEERYLQLLPHVLQRPIQVARGVQRRHADLLSAEAVEDYFTQLYREEGPEGLDVKGICQELESGASSLSFDFPKVAREFRLIQEDTRTVVVPWDSHAEALIGQLRSGGPTRRLMRSLQPYTVSVYPQQFKRLWNAGAAEQCEDFFLLLDEVLYDRGVGLRDAAPGRALIV